MQLKILCHDLNVELIPRYLVSVLSEIDTQQCQTKVCFQHHFQKKLPRSKYENLLVQDYI